MASLWSILRICRFTNKCPSTFKRSASRRSLSSGASICKNDTAPVLSPMPNIRPFLKANEGGAMKSFVESPDGTSHFQLNKNFLSPSGWKMPCSTSSRSFPSRGRFAAPKILRWFNISVSSRFSRDFAFLRLSASSVKVRYLCFTSPLLPFASWFWSMAAYSSRTSSKPSCCGGMAILFEKSPCPATRFTKVSCKPTELSREL